MSTETYDKLKAAKELIHSRYYGVLSTISTEKSLEGFPFGSLTPYSLDHRDEVVILISNLAEHTRNINSDPRVSLTVVEATEGEIQAQGRLTYLGLARQLKSDELDDVADRHMALFPESRRYMQTHDFNFYKIEFSCARFIGGFGKIFWIEKDEYLTPPILTTKQEKFIISHMNQDHQDALRRYITRSYSIDVKNTESPTLVRVLEDSFDVRLNGKIFHLKFPRPIQSFDDTRQLFKEMA
jgi:hypothetical protein